MKDGDRLETIFRTNRPLEADSIASYLITRGVPAMSRWTGMPGGIQEVYADDQSRAEVCVYKADWERAMNVLSDNREQVIEILGSSLPEPGLSMFSGSHLLKAGPGLSEGIRAFPMLLLAPIFLLGEFIKWVQGELYRLGWATKQDRF